MDDQFNNRADSHIRLSHQQAMLFGEQKTAESMLYGAAWYSAWLTAKAAGSKDELAARAAAETERLTEAFRAAAEAAMADVINRFDDLNTKA
ncbi:DUF3144 domain-containing protein [Asticcacaulis sp. 201]|uniref:DUF3144 domain-containing protein n=1 Tax=Asticcacaulis sp. 201 TaxID=3028787 RepID=UPI002915F94F|nr:DUF3144 domain-containing protein [Asticcacaulis sp. 201]MDV6332374.1 DUF3144 domain-containing protein [Asticcacaulis sp. 201]